ncbi:Hpt domain-containing protein [Rhodoferax sp.]|uniref:hybrid sensor histidine kinase/response regulator n=1 Tax=Rhodoferax sp. TaxID=50421 RepID=UPI00284EAEB1|nr:Hpt domain-containing protein [Rhodoferax sp.]MDR3369030.1 Hpt domain-containing protein [Rhodoferax sp.]
MQSAAMTAENVNLEPDLGPLAWVLDELRKSLDGATQALRRFVRDAELSRGSDIGALDASHLRIARQQLHQAVGALEMVGLEVPARMLRAMEALVHKFVQRPEFCSDDAALKVERASFALADYLEAVLKGKALSSVALFPQYRDVLTLVGDDRIHPADLWGYDWRWVDVAVPAEVRPLPYDLVVRSRIDGFILKVVKTGHARSALALRDLSLGFAANQAELHPRVWWMVCAAYFEAVALGLCASDLYEKRAATHVLLQYRTLARGESDISERLVRDLLFFCSQAVPQTPQETPALCAVHQAYGFPAPIRVDYDKPQFGRFDPAVLAQARKRVAAAAETWSSLSGGDVNRIKAAADQFGLVADSIVRLNPDNGKLSAALLRALETVTRSGSAPATALAMEVATAVLYLEAAYEDLDPDSAKTVARGNRLAERLDHVMAGGQPEPLDAWMEELYRRVSDRQVMGSVVDELRTTLGEVETSLDAFFRHPEEKLPLQEVPGRLAQMRGVFSVLGLDQAALAALRMRDSVERLLINGVDTPQQRKSDFDKLGNSLGTLGFLIDMLSYQRELAKKLFVYDDAEGEFRSVMGRQKAADGETAAVAITPPTPPQSTEPVLEPSAPQSLAPDMAAQRLPAPQPAVAPVTTDEEDDAELRSIFMEEAREVIVTGLGAVDALHSHPEDMDQQTSLRRSFHTLKGSSRMVGLNEFGEAAWAMEQLLNAWLPQQLPVGPELVHLAHQALQGFGQWINDIETNQDATWRALPFRRAADSLRLDGIGMDLGLPGAAVPVETPAPAPLTQTDEIDNLLAQSPAVPVSTQEEPIEDVLLTPSGETVDFLATQIGDFGHTHTVDFSETLISHFGDLSWPGAEPQPVAAAGEEGVQETEKVEQPSSAEPDVLEPISESEAPIELLLPDIEADVRSAELGLDLDLESNLALESVPEAPLPVLPEPAAEQPLEPAAEPAEEQVKVIGSLRIGIPLYNVFLNEADEWSRRLLTEVTEWSLELLQPVPDSAIGMAHSLAGSSATVGFMALSELARALEHALEHTHLGVMGLPEHARLFVDAAEDIRRLLHQFAAGFLKQPDPELVAALRAVLDSDLSDQVLPEQDLLENTLTDLDLDFGDVLAPQGADPLVSLREEAEAEATAFERPEAEAQTVPAATSAPMDAGELQAAKSDETELVIDTSGADRTDSLEVVALPVEEDTEAFDSLDVDLFPIFEEEALELLPQLSGALRQWSARPDNLSARQEALRILHTLKGSARLAGAMRLGEMSHRMESAVEQIDAETAQSVQVEPLLTRLDAITACFEALRATPQAELLLPEVAETVPGELTAIPADLSEQPAKAGDESSLVAMKLAPLTQAPSLRRASGQNIRVKSQLIDRMVEQAGEVMISRSRLESRLGQLRGSLDELTGNLSRLRSQLRDIEVQSESQMQSRMAQTKDAEQSFDPLEFDRFTRVQEITRMMAESVHDVATLQHNLQQTVEGVEDDLAAQARQTRDLQRDLLRTRMVEFDSVAERLHGVVRQAAKDFDKLVKLDIEGGSLEMDRGVLDRALPAFEHILRNAVGHGIESALVRKAAGKPEMGVITLKVEQHSNDVAVTFSDDGKGLNLARIRDKALASGAIRADQTLSDEQVANLIFTSGLSTATEVSEMAGRGIGMDVVRNEVNALGGRVELSTQSGQGTQFKLVMPLTTAVNQVVLLRLGELMMGVPANQVELVRRVPVAVLHEAYKSGQFDYNGHDLPFYWGGALLQTSAASSEPHVKTAAVAILRSAGQFVALHVDEVLGNQEVVVKNLGPQLSRLPGLSGMSSLASGAVVLIYNVVALASAYGEQAHAYTAAHAGAVAVEGAQGNADQVASVAVQQVPLILVVDDSITVRRVTQRLLKREGYRVALASDGLQALEQLQLEKPAVVLADIEMPRMDGFDLVRNIRADDKLKDLPVIMITSRIAEKHREYARALGVDHYLGKPYPEDELIALVHDYCHAELSAK